MSEQATLQAINSALQALVDRDRHYEKERAQHIGDIQTMNAAIQALTKSSEDVNKNITKLLLASSQSEQQIDTLKELINAKDSERGLQIERLTDKVEALEKHNAENIGERRASDRHSKFWQDNWHKIFLVFVVVIPVIVYFGKQMMGT